jgi:putative ABC transport system permease protein
MFVRLIADSFTRRPRRKLLTAAALALGMAVATAALSVSLDAGDRLSKEFRSLGANLLVTPEADSLPLEIGGVDYRPVNSGAYLPEADLPKLKTIFWHNNIVAFAPILEAHAQYLNTQKVGADPARYVKVVLIGTWSNHTIKLPDGSAFDTGIDKTNPWWKVQGNWFFEGRKQVIVGTTLAQHLGIRPGDEILLSIPDPSKMVQLFIPYRVTGTVSTGSSEDEAIIMPLDDVQKLGRLREVYRKLYVSALSKPEDDFARRDPKAMSPAELERWSCSPYVSSIAYAIKQVLPGADVRVIHRVADSEGNILTRVRSLLWLVTFVALLAAALAVGASSAASIIERRSEIGLMKALGASSSLVGVLLAAEQLVLAFVGGGLGYALGIFLARILGQRIFGIAPEPSFLVFFAIIALAAIITLLGSAPPLRRASHYEPAPILRGE